MTNIEYTDEFVTEFFEKYLSEENVIREVDLLEANPDIAEQVTHGGFTVTLSKIEFASLEGRVLYTSFADEGQDPDPLEDWLGVFETAEEATNCYIEMIMTWKRNWDLA